MPENIIWLKQVGIKFKLRRKVRKRFRDAILSSLNTRGKRTDFWALRNIDLSIDKGEVIALIGRNGAGKSTLLRVIAGVYVPDEGSVEVRGRVSPLLALGAGFQADLTGRENIYMNGILLGLSKKAIDAKIKEIIDFSGLGDFIDSPVRTYSSGMIARLGFSIAVSIDPEILLIDEVLGVGDEDFKQKSQEKMRELMTKARVIIVATHNMNFVRDFCHRAIWLEKGHIQYMGPAEEAVEQYLRNR